MFCYFSQRVLGNYQGALDDYNKAIKIDSKYASAYNNRGITKAALGDRKGALEDQKKAVKLDPNFKNYVDLGFSWVVNALNEL
jgi:tetratricopeptide (TPR) repeat protein